MKPNLSRQEGGSEGSGEGSAVGFLFRRITPMCCHFPAEFLASPRCESPATAQLLRDVVHSVSTLCPHKNPNEVNLPG